MKRNNSNIEKHTTPACCILHNLCELRGDDYEDEWVTHDTPEDAPPNSKFKYKFNCCHNFSIQNQGSSVLLLRKQLTHNLQTI